MAIAALLAEHGVAGRDRQPAKILPRTTQLTPSVSIVREPVSAPAIKKALSAAFLVRKNTGPEEPAQPPRPSPDHTWVVRGSGGYWRKTSKKASE